MRYPDAETNDSWRTCTCKNKRCRRRFEPAYYKGPEPRYCSSACRQAAYRLRPRKAPRA